MRIGNGLRLAAAMGLMLCGNAASHAQMTGGMTGGGGAMGGGGGGGQVGAGASIGSGQSIGTGGQAGSFAGGQGGPAGAATTQAGRATGGTNVIPTPSNVLKGTYNNPMYFGLQAPKTVFSYTNPSTTSKSFGQPLYGVLSTQTTARTTGNTTQNGGSFNTLGYYRANPYSTVLSEDVPIVQRAVAVLENELKGALERAKSRLNTNSHVTISVEDGGVVLLQGQVASAREGRVLQGMISMTPGVRGVRNELAFEAK
ncbi:MAG: BON domain-containing protein [Gemmataceae bacterium]|nr:BON domain-containing protein [Gemmataceae bacterium]MCI0737667.1 BON domain-containing protein [Gemmataceae bacterium]